MLIYISLLFTALFTLLDISLLLYIAQIIPDREFYIWLLVLGAKLDRALKYQRNRFSLLLSLNIIHMLHLKRFDILGPHSLWII